MTDGRLPYFDRLFARFSDGDADYVNAFGRNVHWGYWEDPRTADGSIEDFVSASDAMTDQVLHAARIRNGTSVVDVGCGFGGTIGRLNEHYSDLRIAGVNIDERQLERARQLVTPRARNQIEYCHADACDLPFPDESFDVVLAVECIFHFRDRLAFLKRARKVLKPGGRIVISDFVGANYFVPLMALANLKKGDYGRISVLSSELYHLQARLAGLRIVLDRDVTKNTLPTYPVLYTMRRSSEDDEAQWATRQQERLALNRIVTYRFYVMEAR